MREDVIVFPRNIQVEPFQITVCGKSFCDGTYKINRPNATVTCMEYIYKGRGQVRVDNVSFCAEMGDIYILPAGKDHYYYSDDKDPWEKIWFNIRGSFIESTLRAYGLEGVYHIKNLDLHHLFEKFIADAQSLKDNHTETCFDICAADFLQIVQGISSAPALQEKHTPESKVQRLKNKIDTLTDFTQSFDEIIAEFFYTKSHVIRAFRAEYGITPYNYLLEHKFSTAKLLLKNTAMSITEISQKLGFSNCHYFSGFFSKRAGISPKKYRES